MVAELPNLVQGDYEWWLVYGPFERGLGKMPHIGHLIRWYRIKHGWGVEDLAAALGISKARVYDLEEDIAMPKDISRREALVDLLKIPPLLLAVPILEMVPASGKIRILGRQDIQKYEDILALCWETYYTASAQRTANIVRQCLTELDEAIATASSIARDQLYALKARFAQLDGVIARDRLDLHRSLTSSQEAIDLARHLGNPSLLASALFRRARTYLQMDRLDLAAKDLDEALPEAQRSGAAALNAYVHICWSETYSKLFPGDLQIQQTCLSYLDTVARNVRASKAGVLREDGSFTRVDLPGLLMERTNVLRRFNKIPDAHDILDVVRDQLGPDLTRWQGNLRIAEAQLCLADHDVDGSCLVALDGLKIVRATRSLSNEKKIEAIFLRLYQGSPRQKLVRELGHELGYSFPKTGELLWVDQQTSLS